MPLIVVMLVLALNDIDVSFIQVLAGTLELERTTVPFMYNLDDVVEGLSVIDFPGVDDRDETIPGLAKLLLTLAQLVILVVDYR